MSKYIALGEEVLKNLFYYDNSQQDTRWKEISDTTKKEKRNLLNFVFILVSTIVLAAPIVIQIQSNIIHFSKAR